MDTTRPSGSISCSTSGDERGHGHSTRFQPPREDWESLFCAHGMKHPLPRMHMLDGFNEGWIRFEAPPMRSFAGASNASNSTRYSKRW